MDGADEWVDTMRIVLIGPPGCGKGTQGKCLQRQFAVPHVSSGDLLRAATQQGTSLGAQAKRFMDAGKLVPDELLLDVIGDRLGQADCSGGFILDGFPRTLAQAKALTAMLSRHAVALDHAISLRVARQDLVMRLSGRRTCRQCGTMYHVVFDPPAAEGQCTRCHGSLYQRDDDREATILARLDVYDAHTVPLLAHYREQGLLRDIDGGGSRDAVCARVLQSIEDAG